MIFVVTVGSKPNSLSQISRALKNGFAVSAELIFCDVLENYRESLVQRYVITKMTDLHESAYYWLVSMDYTDYGPLDYLDMYNSRWEFKVIER